MSKRFEHASDGNGKAMFSPPPSEWVDESRQAWRAKQESAASTREEPPLAVATTRQQLCLFTEEELNPPAPARNKKPAPAEGVSFF